MLQSYYRCFGPVDAAGSKVVSSYEVLRSLRVSRVLKNVD